MTHSAVRKSWMEHGKKNSVLVEIQLIFKLILSWRLGIFQNYSELKIPLKDNSSSSLNAA